ncbi:hypothetical protein HYC85_027827 [Camellia sinensis]|uniref:DUF659 domain-containing protein n=1 Tax=Camellia sinensis TaxID=4442 RepID=A0A7J7FXD3_CAMSI|nr:hypothetical protein HYC85_027827 [Camellia sinensis]
MAVNEVAINIHDHGTALDDHKRRIECNYCGKVVSGFSRLKCHLGGIRGDVVPCEKVPTNVKDLMRDKLLEKKKGNLSKEVGELYHPNLPWKRNWCPDSNAVKDGKLDMNQAAGSGSKKRVKVNSISENSVTEVCSFPKRSQAAPSAMEDLSSQQAERCIGRFFYETGIDFSAAKSPSFQRMISATIGSGQIGVRIPSCQELKGWILWDEVKEMQQYIKEIRNSWASTGCSMLLDGWIDGNGRNLINILVHCPQGPIYLRSLDISAALGNINALQLLFDEVIDEIGAENLKVSTFKIWSQLQVDEYRAAKGSFGQGSADRQSSNSPALWWSYYGGQCPELQRLAIRILSQTCDGASKYQLKKSVAEKLLTKGRNHIEQQRLNDLTFVHYNLQLRNFESRVSSDSLVEEIDPMNDWIVDEAQEVVLQNCEPTWIELDCVDKITSTTTTRGVNIREGSPSFHPKEEPS